MATRHNDSLNPGLKNGSSGWFATGGSRITTATGLDAVAPVKAGAPSRTAAWSVPAGTTVVAPTVVRAPGVLPGQLRSHAVYVKASAAGCTATLSIQSYYDDAGPEAAVFLGSSSGSATSLTAGQWVRVGHRATMVAANPGGGTIAQQTGPTEARTVVTSTGTGTIQYSLHRAEGGTSLDVAGTEPVSHFDGDTTGAAWDGTDGSSASTLTLPDTHRVYMANAPADRVPVAAELPFWDGSSLVDPLALTNAPEGAAAFVSLAETAATAPFLVMIKRWVSGHALTAGTIPAEDLPFVMGRLESAADADFAWAAGGWVMAPDGSRKATLFEVNGTVEWPVGTVATDAVAGQFTVLAAGITAADIDPGDRIVLELGYISSNTITASRSGTLVYGGTATPDLVSGDAGANLDRPSWADIPISAGLTFADPEVDTGTLAGTLPAPTAALTATSSTGGALAASAPTPTAAITATASTTGDLDGQAPTPTAALAGDVAAQANLAGALPTPTAALTAQSSTTGVVAGTAPTPTAALTGTVTGTGSLAATTPTPTAVIAGDTATAGALAGTTPLPAAALEAAASSTGELAAATPMPASVFAGDVSTAGVLAAATPVPVAQIDASGAAHGTLDATTPLPEAALAGATSTSGSLEAQLPSPTAQIAGTLTATGQLDATTPVPVAAIGADASTGALAATTPVPVAALAADTATAGALAGTAPVPVAALAADTSTVGDLAGTAPTPSAALTATTQTSGVLAGATPVPVAALTGTTGDPSAVLAAVAPLPTAAIDAVVHLSGVLAAVAPMVVAHLTAVPPTPYTTPLHAGQPVWGAPRLRAGQPVHAAGLVAGEPTRD